MKKIAIIGAGISGITAAKYLAEAGHIVLLLEATNTIGGRVRSFVDGKTGERIDNGQHILIGAYKELLHLINDAELTEILHIQKSLEVCYKGTKNKDILKTDRLPGELGFLLGLWQFKLLSKKSKIEIIKFGVRLKFSSIQIKNKTALEFLVENNQTKESIEIFWQPLAIATLNTELEYASAELLYYVMKNGFFAGRRNSRLIIPKVDFNDLLQKIINHNNIEILYNKKVKEIIFGNDMCITINTNDEEYQADLVVSAIPHYQLKKILPINNKTDEINNIIQNDLDYTSIVNVYLWFDREVMEEHFVTFTGSNLQWAFNKRKLYNYDKEAGEKYPGLISIVFSSAEEMLSKSQKEIAFEAWQELKIYYPIVNTAELLHWRVLIEKFATFKADNKNLETRKKMPQSINNLFIAGEWTERLYPSTLESATMSGKRIANLIIKKYE